jgi:hypothetical protein
MISRRTLYFLLAALLLASSLYLWNVNRWDDCQRYMAGDVSLPSSQIVESESHSVEVPCEEWFPRQSPAILLLCLLDLLLIVVFVLNALSDVRDWRQNRSHGR